ncbi:MAG: hypothetical protein KTR31_00995 [Myxococcales bacterium]|nr:hypothetical protein [Myxococcales bacterium]
MRAGPALLWAFVVVGCDQVPRPGTAVGNPGDMDVVTRVLDQDVSLVDVEVPLRSLVLDPCDAAVATAVVEEVVVLDGLAPSEEPVGFPGGEWCRLTVELDGPVVAMGQTATGTLFLVELPLERIELSGRMAMDDDLFLLRLDLPIEAQTLDSEGDDVELLAEDPTAIAWADRAAEESTLWRDVVLDGVLTPDDQLLGPLSTSSPPNAAADGAGCGCGSGPGGSAWMVVLLSTVLTRRRYSASRKRGS